MKNLFTELFGDWTKIMFLITLIAGVISALLSWVDKKKTFYKILTGILGVALICQFAASHKKNNADNAREESRILHTDSVEQEQKIVNHVSKANNDRLRESVDTLRLLGSLESEKIDERFDDMTFQNSLTDVPVDGIRFFFNLRKYGYHQTIQHRLFGYQLDQFSTAIVTVNLATMQWPLSMQFIPNQRDTGIFLPLYDTTIENISDGVATPWSLLFVTNDSICEFGYQFGKSRDSAAAIYTERQVYYKLRAQRYLFCLNISNIDATELELGRIYNEILTRIPRITLCIDMGGTNPYFLMVDLEPTEGDIDPVKKIIQLKWELNGVPVRNFSGSSPSQYGDI